MNKEIPDHKKHEYWNHFVAHAYEHDGFPSGVTPKRLREIKPEIWATAFFWHDILHRHMDKHLRPDELSMETREHIDLEVLGEAPCIRGSYSGKLTVSASGTEKQSVFLRKCCCGNGDNFPSAFLGHSWVCLEVVPFYHIETDLATQALEQICDEHKLQPEMFRTELGWWRVWLVKTPLKSPVQHAARGASKSLALAICQALAGLKK